MVKLIALVPILNENRQYESGEELPTNDSDTVSAWIEAGSAVWRDGDDTTKKNAAKAKPKTAPAGITGIAQPATSAEADLVGKIPSKKARGIVKEETKTAPKSLT